jgi:hypothetical protein
MDNQADITRRVGSLETGMARVAEALNGLKSILDDVRTQVVASRPSFWVLVPSILAFAAMVVSGVIAVTSLRSDIASLYAIKDQREVQFSRMQSEIDRIEQRQWLELRMERDHLRDGGKHGEQPE